MKKQLLWLLLAVLCGLAMVLAGCSGSNSKSLKSGVPLIIGADTMPGAGMTKGAATIAAPLDAGATVQAIDFRTGDVVATGTLSADGTVTITLPAGLTVAVVITGKRNGKDYRMSLLIPVVPSADVVAPFIASPQSTVATEALAQAHFHEAIDPATYQAAYNAASSFAEADVSLGGGIVKSGSSFGNNSLDATAAKPVTDVTSLPLNGKLSLAKNAVIQINNYQQPFFQLEKEFLSENENTIMVATESLSHAFSNINWSDLQTKYSGMVDRLSKLILPSISGTMTYNGNLVDFTGLTLGHGYDATFTDNLVRGMGGKAITLTDNATLNTANQYTIKMGTETLVIKKVNGNWDFTETSTADTTLNYHLSYPDTENYQLSLSSNTFTASLSLKDTDVATPVAFNGTLSLTPKLAASTVTIAFNGTISSTELNASGNISIDFPITSVLSITSGHASIVFPPLTGPTSFSMTNASLHFAYGNNELRLSGTITGTGDLKQDGNGKSYVWPKTINLTNGKLYAEASGYSLSLSGDIAMTGQSYPKQDTVEFIPTSLSLNNIALEIHTKAVEAQTKDAGLPATTIRMTGNFSAAITVVAGTDKVLPKSLSLNGTYTNSQTTIDFSGSINGSCTNTTIPDNMKNIKASFSVQGTLKKYDRVFYDVNVALNSDGNGNLTGNINNLQWSDCYLRGNLSITLPSDSEQLQNATLTLTNQDGVKFNIALASGTPSGTITVGADKEADLAIGQTPGTIDVTFIDSTTDSIYLLGGK